MSLKSLIPTSLKTKIRLAQRSLADRLDGSAALFARPGEQSAALPHSIFIEQEIKPSHLFENKLANLRLAAEKVNRVAVGPGQVFSFWKTIGPPTDRNGFRAGRNIVGGRLSEAVGGGLCQASSILYHLSMVGGLTVVERHNHTVDLYDDTARFTPLGSDATVVFGHKDLRVKNQLGFPVRFFLQIVDEKLTAFLFSEMPVERRPLFFNQTDGDGFVHVATTDAAGNLLATSRYRKPAA